jgi:hypothetical protein
MEEILNQLCGLNALGITARPRDALPRNRGSISDMGEKFFLPSNNSDRLWGPPSLRNECQVGCPWRKVCCMTLTTYLHLAFMACNSDDFMRSALFWDIMQHRVVIVYRRFGTTYRFHLQRIKHPKKKKR